MASDQARAWNQAQTRMWPGTHSNGRPKLTPDQRDQIKQRLADGENPRVLATEYGVSAAHVRTYR